MAKTSVGAPPGRTAEYVLIAMVNTGRASAVRNIALEFCPNIAMVRDGQEAVDYIDRAGPPRLLITELSLPRLDGFAVLRHLRRQQPTARPGAIVVSSHELLRTAAMKLAESLGVAQILPLDIERTALRRAISDAMSAQDPATSVTARRDAIAAHVDKPSLDDVMSRMLLDLTRQFRVPVAAAYLRVREDRRFALYGSIPDPSPSLDWSKVLELLPHAASGEDPLVVPELENHPLFGHTPGLSAIRGFAGVPLVRPGGVLHWGALGVFDSKALTLTSDDIDALAAFARDVAAEIEQQLGPPHDVVVTKSERDEQFLELEQLAGTDPLTGLANRRGAEKSVAGEISRAERERKPLSCIMLDIDRFKQVNDTMGHAAGDQVLRELSALLRKAVRAYDIVARWGGEEFLLVLPGANLEAARQLAERIRDGVQNLTLPGPGRITISGGVAEFDRKDYSFDAALHSADDRLFQAKKAGRNRIV